MGAPTAVQLAVQPAAQVSDIHFSFSLVYFPFVPFSYFRAFVLAAELVGVSCFTAGSGMRWCFFLFFRGRDRGRGLSQLQLRHCSVSEALFFSGSTHELPEGTSGTISFLTLLL